MPTTSAFRFTTGADRMLCRFIAARAAPTVISAATVTTWEGGRVAK